MSVQSEIARLNNAKSSISSAIAGKGVTVPSGTKLDGMATLIGNISSGLSSENVTVNFSYTATNTNYRPYVYYLWNGNGRVGTVAYKPASGKTGSTTLTVAKGSMLCVQCKLVTTNPQYYGVISYTASNTIVGFSDIGGTATGDATSPLFLINGSGSLSVTIGLKTGSSGGSIG